MSSVAGRVARWTSVLLVAALGTVGVGTATLIHVQQVRGLDRALLAAAHGHGPSRYEVEHSESPVQTRLVSARDGWIPADALAAARRYEVPVWVDAGDLRVVLVTTEDDDDRHRLVAAFAPRVTVRGSVGPFAVAWMLMAAAVAAFAAALQVVVVGRALRPLDLARDEVARVVGLGQGARLSPDGPDELRPLLTAVNALLDRLDGAFRAQNRFTAEAAHELRTPVTAMLGELDVALRQPRDLPAYRAVLVSVREEVDRLRRLVDGLTALARLDAGAIEGHREPVRAAEVAASAVRAEREALQGCRLDVQVVADPELEAHRVLLEVALANLLRNAARYAPGADVRVRVDRDGPFAVFDVEDGGPGVPVADREAVFDRFARAGEARRAHGGGLGLGLPIAREIARRHGGDCVIDASSLGGARARLTVRLPDTRPSGPPTSSSSAATDGGRS